MDIYIYFFLCLPFFPFLFSFSFPLRHLEGLSFIWEWRLNWLPNETEGEWGGFHHSISWIFLWLHMLRIKEVQCSFQWKMVAIWFCEMNVLYIFIFYLTRSFPAVVLKFVIFVIIRLVQKLEGAFSISRSDTYFIVGFYSFSTIKLLRLSDIYISEVLGTSYICPLFIN